MEEIGARTSVFTLEGIRGHQQQDIRALMYYKDVLASDNPWLNRLEVEFVRESVQERNNELERTKEQLRIS